MKKIPVLPTLFVCFAVAAMIGLGVWQLQRAQWKENLLAVYAANSKAPAIAFPAVPVPDQKLLFRKASGTCLSVANWIVRGGANRAGESGWRHIALCRTGGAEGPGMAVDIGWSRDDHPPKTFTGGRVSGILDWDRDHVFRLVSQKAAPGLEPSAAPSIADIPNNHRAYAVQWFLFAAVAMVIYALVLRQRWRQRG
jgi:cytochrome oxidase assembly protein ShyY1